MLSAERFLVPTVCLVGVCSTAFAQPLDPRIKLCARVWIIAIFLAGKPLAFRARWVSFAAFRNAAFGFSCRRKAKFPSRLCFSAALPRKGSRIRQHVAVEAAGIFASVPIAVNDQLRVPFYGIKANHFDKSPSTACFESAPFISKVISRRVIGRECAPFVK